MNERWGHHLINFHLHLEMLAMFLMLKHFLPSLKGHHVLKRTDNTTVVAYINRQGPSQTTPLAHVGTQTDFVEHCQSFIPEGDTRTGGHELGCGPAIHGQSPLQGVEIEQGSGRTDLEHIRQSNSGPVCVPGQCSVLHLENAQNR